MGLHDAVDDVVHPDLLLPADGSATPGGTHADRCDSFHALSIGRRPGRLKEMKGRCTTIATAWHRPRHQSSRVSSSGGGAGASGGLSRNHSNISPPNTSIARPIQR